MHARRQSNWESVSPDIRLIDVPEEPRRRYPGLKPNIRRTLERRINACRTFNGPQRDMIFRREHEPGRIGFSNFTDASALHMTIVGGGRAHL